MARKDDRRIQKTRKALRDALHSLVLDRGYDDLSVQDITDKANLGRATFYLHFREKDELLEEIAEISGRLPSTVRTWCLGQNTPPPYIQEKIAQHFGTSPEILFPAV